MTDLSKGGAAPEPDPYRYGYPQVAPGRISPTGKQILSATWRLLKLDRELILLPVLGAAAGFVAFAVLFAPGLVLGLGSGHDNRPALYVFAVLGGFAASVIGIFFQAALVVGAYQRADGYDPTSGSALAGAWRLRGQIFGWAVFTTIVGTVIRTVEQRLGLVGKIVGFLGGVAWAVATFFAVPVLVAEGVGPIEAVKRSAATIRQVWGTSVRTTLRFGVLSVVLVLVPLVVVIAGIGIATSGSPAGGVVVAAIGALAFITAGIVLGAVSLYARAVIYRWATGRPVPGIDPALFPGAFRVRRGRR